MNTPLPLPVAQPGAAAPGGAPVPPQPALYPVWLAPATVGATLSAMSLLALKGSPALVWIAALAGMVLCLAAAGQSVTGRWMGVLIDERNVMSLSRFQLLAWMALVLSSLLAVAWVRLFAGLPDALAIDVDLGLWVLLGVSTLSLVGSGALLKARAGSAAGAGPLETPQPLLALQGTPVDEVSHLGSLYANRTAAAATWSDLITGEQVVNAAHVDVARLQLLVFTLLVLLAYAAEFIPFFFSTPAHQLGTKFPGLSVSLVALIAISHAGYLAAKVSR